MIQVVAFAIKYRSRQGLVLPLYVSIQGICALQGSLPCAVSILCHCAQASKIYRVGTKGSHSERTRRLRRIVRLYVSSSKNSTSPAIGNLRVPFTELLGSANSLLHFLLALRWKCNSTRDYWIAKVLRKTPFTFFFFFSVSSLRNNVRILLEPLTHTHIYIIELVDSIRRDERDATYTQYIANAGISCARYTITHFKHHHCILWPISNQTSV